MIIALVSLMSWSGLFTEPRELGAVVMILVAAAFAGVAVSRYVGRDRGPTFFGVSAALALVAGLAFAGVEAAGFALWVMLAIAAVLGVFALVA